MCSKCILCIVTCEVATTDVDFLHSGRYGRCCILVGCFHIAACMTLWDDTTEEEESFNRKCSSIDFIVTSVSQCHC